MAAKNAEKKTNVDINEENEATEPKAEEVNEPTVEELKARIAELESLLKDKEDQHLRMAAEYENFRRRSREEREATYTEAVADTVGEILPIIDNLERAALYDDEGKVKDGLVMIAKSVEGVFARYIFAASVNLETSSRVTGNASTIVLDFTILPEKLITMWKLLCEIYTASKRFILTLPAFVLKAIPV